MLLDNVNSPDDLKKIEVSLLPDLCQEIRDVIISAITSIGGHLGGSLGVTELTVALHYVFNTPQDKLIWDIGHQAHPHKILTGRKDKIDTVKKTGGLSGFCSIFESKYDSFGAGHSSTSVSAAIGFLQSNIMLLKKDDWVIAVIGDGSIGAGMFFEALNNVPTNGKMLIVLNDNDMSICPSVGNISKYLKKSFKNNNTDSPLFESFDIDYIGIEDGHNIIGMIDRLKQIKNERTSPVVWHIKTKKGAGYKKAENLRDCAHSVQGGNAGEKRNTFTDFVGDHLLQIFAKDQNTCVVTPAMVSGSGLLCIQEKFPERVFDVGIAEQHSITFAAGMAISGIKTFCAIYSTFLQRGYDQVIHDVAIQRLPVKFLIDRAGFVGSDGATHHGSFDISMLVHLPHFVIMAPRSGAELIKMINTAMSIDNAPSAIRYAKEIVAENYIYTNDIIQIGKGEFINKGQDIAILSLGGCMCDVMNVHTKLLDQGKNATIFDLKFAKPIDKDAIAEIASNHSKIVCVEDGSYGGVSSIIARFLFDIEYKGSFKAFCHEDSFIEHASIEQQKTISKMSAEDIYNFCIN